MHMLFVEKIVLVLSDESETLLLGSELAKTCVMGCVIYLNGYIGTGKSVFCKGFLKSLGYMNHVKSPTYTLVESYFLANRYIYHIDCYRLRSERELVCMGGLRDNVDEKSIFLIEWPPDKETNVLPSPDIIITINFGSDEQCRRVVIKSITDFGVIVLNDLLCMKKFKYAVES